MNTVNADQLKQRWNKTQIDAFCQKVERLEAEVTLEVLRDNKNEKVIKALAVLQDLRDKLK